MAVNNLLKPGNLEITLKDHRMIEFNLQEVALPGFQLGETWLNNPSQNWRNPGDNITWNELVCTVICDEEMNAYFEAYDYITAAKNPKTGEMKLDEVRFDAKLTLLTNKNNPLRVITFYDAWIRSLTEAQLTVTSAEDEPVVFTVEIVFDYFDHKKLTRA